MHTLQTIVSRNTYRIPPRLKLVLSRLSSLLLLFQRSPVVQFLFPEANLLGGAAVANSFTLAITTVVGLGTYDAFAGVSPATMTQVQPLANSATVPAAVGTLLNFEVLCDADSYPKSWKCDALPTNNLTLTHKLSPPADNWSNTVTGTPGTPGLFPVTISANRYTNNTGTGDNVVNQAFNIYVLGFSTHPAATTLISSGGNTILNCVATGKPAAATLSYQWYQGTSGTTTTPVGTNSASFTTPALTSSTNYWVKITSVLSPSSVSANSTTAAVNVTTAYSSWASVLPAGQNGPKQTPRNDGVTNLEKFAFNMDASKADVRMLSVGGGGTAGLPGGAVAAGKLRIEFLRRKASTNPGITYTPQFSSSLGSWSDFTGTESVSELSPVSPTWERVVVEDPKTFGRLKVVQVP